MEKVLIALDYNPTAQKVAEVGFSMAKSMNADVIVMGSHSRKVSSRIIMGSVTKRVLQHSSIPLLIVPTKLKK